METKYTPEQLEAIRQAAPELLEALEYTCNLLDRLPRLSDVDRIDAPGEAASVLKSARAAIAKATGNTL